MIQVAWNWLDYLKHQPGLILAFMFCWIVGSLGELSKLVHAPKCRCRPEMNCINLVCHKCEQFLLRVGNPRLATTESAS